MQHVKKIVQVILIALGWFILAQLLTLLLQYLLLRHIAVLNQGLGAVATQLFSTGILVLLLYFYYRRRDPQVLPLPRQKWFRYCGLGYLAGLFFFTLVWLGTLGLNAASVHVVLHTQAWFWLLILFVGYVIQAISEELLTRGYMVGKLLKTERVYVVIIINSLVFAGLHLMNTGINGLAFINILAFSILLTLLRLRFDNLWVAIAFHSAWNFAEGPLFGVPVSGGVSDALVLKTTSHLGFDLVNGGSFGFEGGFVILLVLLIAIAGLVWWEIQRPKIND
ncbi:CPBP family intramembrane glutamic endopeptidase [Loigolactobacillus jiayinensis]|uniref:CPBP family intramembrane glutamic endopeptidase n=1 Tax=Loigolactobacillus jiayinensis TaxID=2486016 RepID=A0ABW1RD00_9LACO|nr:CPBP family intramembrane glutamic endopeptidase [Loigolactobacillus jiayinensis]